MAIKDYFKPVTSMNTDEVRDFLKEKNPDDYNLIDVRTPAEYASGHIPGARHIPLDSLQAHAGDLDPKKPTIAY